MTPEHTDMTGAARLREALEYLLDANAPALVSEAEGCQCAVCRAVRFAREALAAVPEAPEPVYEWRAVEEDGRFPCGPFNNEARAAEWARRIDGILQRRTAPGPWERVEEGTER